MIIDDKKNKLTIDALTYNHTFNGVQLKQKNLKEKIIESTLSK